MIKEQVPLSLTREKKQYIVKNKQGEVLYVVACLDDAISVIKENLEVV